MIKNDGEDGVKEWGGENGRNFGDGRINGRVGDMMMGGGRVGKDKSG